MDESWLISYDEKTRTLSALPTRPDATSASDAPTNTRIDVITRSLLLHNVKQDASNGTIPFDKLSLYCRPSSAMSALRPLKH